MKFAEFVQSTTSLDEFPEDNKPHVAIVGRSNVGKSSLVNHLTGQNNLARVSSKAGHTQTINLYNIEKRYYLVDLPGYGFTKKKAARGTFGELIVDYVSNADQLALVLVIIDASVGPTDLDIDMFELLHSLGMPLVVVVNKVDKLSKNKVFALMQKLTTSYPFATFVAHSITTKEHRQNVLNAINESLATQKNAAE